MRLIDVAAVDRSNAPLADNRRGVGDGDAGLDRWRSGGRRFGGSVDHDLRGSFAPVGRTARGEECDQCEEGNARHDVWNALVIG